MINVVCTTRTLQRFIFTTKLFKSINSEDSKNDSVRLAILLHKFLCFSLTDFQ